jgi:hypothetical protein
MYQAAVLLFAGSIELLHFLGHFLIKRKDIAGFNVGRLVLFQEEESIASSEEAFEDGLLPRIQRDRDCGGIHDRVRREG